MILTIPQNGMIKPSRHRFPLAAHVKIEQMDIRAIASYFSFRGDFVQAAPVEVGHINDTYVVTYRKVPGPDRRYILQRINRSVFKDPPGLMQNIEMVTRHLCTKIAATGGNPARETLNLVETTDQNIFYRDAQGEYWRAFLFIENARTYETSQSQAQIYQAALAFGQFQQQLSDFPVEQLVETIPGFHDTPRRFEVFIDSLNRDPINRAQSVSQEIRFIEEREADTRLLADLLAGGQLPRRVTHNNSKLNNVLIDDQTGAAICVLDLDTVMPGVAVFDFGDLVRSAASLTLEDDPDLTRAGLSLESYETLARGYLDAARSFLIPAEMDLLAFSARLITLEQAIRFLADYLNGDRYYKTRRPGHNLDRARTQIALLADMEKKFNQMRLSIKKYC